MISPLAVQKRATRRRWRRIAPWGVCFHTTGRGIVRRARDTNRPVDQLAVEWYRPRATVHYLINYEGLIYQFMPDNWRGAHVGISRKERNSYLSGKWIYEVPEKPRELWQRRWPKYDTPQHLYPTKSPNACYVGVEVIPLWTKRSNGLWFTNAQHSAVAALSQDLADRHRWPVWWQYSPRLVSHDDLDAFARWDDNGGWDIGALREQPRFDWTRATPEGPATGPTPK